MQIIINDHRKLHAVKTEFHQAFPNFKLEFLKKPSKVGGSPSEKELVKDGNRIGQARVVHNKGLLTITAGMTAAELTQNFIDVYGLSVKVLEKKNAAWVDAAPSAIIRV